MRNVYGIIVAGGQGSRLGSKLPKQYLKIGGKPIIMHTIIKFSKSNEFDKIIVLVPQDWINYTKDIIKEYINVENIVVIGGGKDRNETIKNGVNYIIKNLSYNDDTIIVTHDSVRPFVTYEIIKESVKSAKKYGCCNTAIKATDTIFKSKDGKFVKSIPKRERMYQTQTPQSFNMLAFKKAYDNLSDEQKEKLTDACNVMLLNDKPIYIIKGDLMNIKITYPSDIKIAEDLLEIELEINNKNSRKTNENN